MVQDVDCEQLRAGSHVTSYLHRYREKRTCLNVQHRWLEMAAVVTSHGRTVVAYRVVCLPCLPHQSHAGV